MSALGKEVAMQASVLGDDGVRPCATGCTRRATTHPCGLTFTRAASAPVGAVFGHGSPPRRRIVMISVLKSMGGVSG